MDKSILITGVAGSGKSSVCKGLASRGYTTFSIEDAKGLFTMINKKTGKVFDNYDNDDIESVKQHDWICNKDKLQGLVRDNAKSVVFYCGTASNLDELLHLFDIIILLKVSPDVLRKRLSERTSNEFGRTVEIQDWILSWKDWWEDHMREKGVITVDADRDLKEVTTDVLEKSKVSG